MANRPRLTGPETEEIEDGEILDGQFENISELFDENEETKASILSELGQRATGEEEIYYKVYRMLPDKGKNAGEWLFDTIPGELNIMPTLRDKYGQGTYTVRIYVNDKLWKKPTIRVGPALAHVNVPEKAGKESDDNKALIDLVGKLADKIDAIGQRNQNPQPAFNAMDQMTVMVTMMKTLKDIMGPSEPKNDIKDQIEILKLGVDFARGGSGDDGNEKNAYDVFTKLAEVFGGPISKLSEKLIENPPQLMYPTQPQHSQMSQIPQQTIPVQGQQIVTDQNTGQSSVTNEGENMGLKNHLIKQQVKPYLDFLVEHAKKDHSPVTYAEMIADSLPQDQIQEYLLQGNPIEFLSGIHPDVKTYSAWFEEVLKNLSELLTEPEPVADTEEHAISPANETAPSGTDDTASDT